MRARQKKSRARQRTPLRKMTLQKNAQFAYSKNQMQSSCPVVTCASAWSAVKTFRNSLSITHAPFAEDKFKALFLTRSVADLLIMCGSN